MDVHLSHPSRSGDDEDEGQGVSTSPYPKSSEVSNYSQYEGDIGGRMSSNSLN